MATVVSIINGYGFGIDIIYVMEPNPIIVS